MFTIDDYTWPWPCDIERAAEVRPSEISGMMLDKSWFNDVIGTYMQYTVSVAVPPDQRNAHTILQDLLTEPVDGHAFALPYNEGILQLTGRVRNVSDVYVRLANGGTCWKGLRFTIVANHPTRAIGLHEAITRGRAPVPEIVQPAEGDTYVWYSGRWSKSASYPNADVIPY